MPTQDEDFIPYHDREMPWERRRDRPPLFQEEAPKSGGRRPRRGGCGGCLMGCGCLVIFLIAVLVGVVTTGGLAIRGLGARVLTGTVGSAMDDSIVVNGEVVTVPDAWQEPWRATAAAYGAAYEAGAVSHDHFGETLALTFGTILSDGGAIADADLRGVCEHMRAALPEDARAQLPPFPDPPSLDTTSADIIVAPQDATAEWAPWAALEPPERRAQLDLRRALLTKLSALHGPATAQALVPAEAVVYDFRYDVQPYRLLMDDWAIQAGASAQPAMQPTRGFGGAPCMSLGAPADTAHAEASIRFTTTAGSVRLWYLFEGTAEDGRVTVSAGGRTVREEDWPGRNPRAMVRDDWRTVVLENLGAGTPTAVQVRMEVNGTREPCLLYIDDLVFAP